MPWMFAPTSYVAISYPKAACSPLLISCSTHFAVIKNYKSAMTGAFTLSKKLIAAAGKKLRGIRSRMSPKQKKESTSKE